MFITKDMRPLKRNLSSLLAGCVYPLGFAPFSWWLLPVFSLAVLFHLWTTIQTQALMQQGAKQHAKQQRFAILSSALYFGLGMFGVGVSWVYVSMVNFGGMAPFMAVIAVLLFALILTVFTVGAGLVYFLVSSRFSSRQQLTILLPSLWIIFETLRGVVLSGFPWLSLGYAGVDTWFSAWASIAGVQAVGFVLAFIAGSLAYIWQVYQHKKSRLAVRSKSYGALLMLSVMLLASWGLDTISWASMTGEKLNITLIQADIPINQKWKPENRENIMQTYLSASKAAQDADLIVWPEGALPMVFDQIPADYLSELHNLPASIAFGGAIRETVNGQNKIYNGITLLGEQSLGAGGEIGVQQYRKRHLVPFGEFFPLKPLLGWLFETLKIPMSDFSSGAHTQTLFEVKGFKLLPTICYEDAFPEDWRHQVSEAHALLNISEDAWFGDSFAPHQRLQMARMRAIEFERPVIRVSNSGLSTVIDPNGGIEALSPQFQPALFSENVFAMQGDTPYVKYGQWPLWAWLLICFIFAFVLRGLSINKRAK